MCGIAGIVSLSNSKIENIANYLNKIRKLISHRGPDDSGLWINQSKTVGFAHNRLSIIDLSDNAHQPMLSETGHVIVYNGEIYNHIELRALLEKKWDFKSNSDTEIILAAYVVYGYECLKYFKGMFGFAIWDGNQLFCARDHFGIKPFYYTEIKNNFYFASEAKALLPVLPSVSTNRNAFCEYMTFQYLLGSQTLFDGVLQLEPAHAMVVSPKGKKIWKYWDVNFEIDDNLSETQCFEKLSELMNESISMHLRSDVPVGAYLSGGIDSSLIGILGSQQQIKPIPYFHGRFLESKDYDESAYARLVADKTNSPLFIKDITADEFKSSINDIIYHMDFPVAGPGVFPQYIISKYAASKVKVILGGQGGDEIFGGYARYLIVFLEQCFKAELEGRSNKHLNIGFLSQHLEILNAYKPMMKKFWQNGLFDAFEERYFKIINRDEDFSDVVSLSQTEKKFCFHEFLKVFQPARFAKDDSYFNAMLHFDLKTSLAGLLHVEDRVSMAHGLESRVPFLYWPLVEFVAQVPPTIKFKNGQMKYLILKNYENLLPKAILNRKDKMGFPVPLTEWMHGELKEFIFDILISGKNRANPGLHYESVINTCKHKGVFSRKVWGLFCYELWQQQFHDKALQYKRTYATEIENI